MREQGYITEKQQRAALDAPAEAVQSKDAGSAQYAADWVVDLLDDFVGAVDGDVVISTTIDRSSSPPPNRRWSMNLPRKARSSASRKARSSPWPGWSDTRHGRWRELPPEPVQPAVSARRQPGSAFKPFVYLAALEKGYRPDSLVRDEPFRYGSWTPENYARKYLGDVSLTKALALSLNTPAARLGVEVGPAHGRADGAAARRQFRAQ